MGWHNAAAFNDLHNFFDTIDLNILLREAILLAYPPVELILALQQHLAPRVIQASGFSSHPISIWKSILAGCKQSVPFTRILLKRFLTRIIEKNPLAKTKAFVDDVSILAFSARWGSVQNILAPALLDFAKGISNLNLIMSPKSTLVTSHKTLSRQLIRELNTHGIKYQSHQSTRDLGITFAAGKAKPVSIFNSRIRSVRHRVHKISGLARISRQANTAYR